MPQRIATTTSPGPLRKAEQTLLGMIARIESGGRSPYYGIETYPKIAGCLARVCEITDESFQEACNRLHVASAHRTEMLKLNTPSGKRIRALAARNVPTATSTSPGPLRKAERTVLTMLARLERGPPNSSSYATDYAYPTLAGRLATICEITGERFLDACDRLNIAPAHRIEILHLNTPAISRLRALSKAPIATATSPGPLRKAERTVLGMIARIESGKRGRYYGVETYPKIAGRLAAICKITRESFRKACERLHISPTHRTEMLKLKTPIGQRVRALAAPAEVSRALG